MLLVGWGMRAYPEELTTRLQLVRLRVTRSGFDVPRVRRKETSLCVFAGGKDRTDLTHEDKTSEAVVKGEGGG